MRTLRPALAIALATLVLSACADEPPPRGPDSEPELEGVTWILDASSIDALEAGAPGDARATVRLEGGEAGGTAACNLYGGSYEVGGAGAISIRVEGMTEMACDEPVMALEAAFVDAIGLVTSFRFDGEALVLEGGGAALRFTAERALPLEGTAWRLDGIAGNGDTVSSVLAGTEITATFDTEGKVAGSGGCNGYGAPYTVDGNAVQIGEIAATQMACAPDVSAQETAFFDALGRAATIRIEGSTLTLHDASGGFLLSFVAA
ncbi:MAG TPA: META domain-containing protein [Actinomycetota bacterium]|nr:META domain-containing protein [Actinomycetota bacterium]